MLIRVALFLLILLLQRADERVQVELALATRFNLLLAEGIPALEGTSDVLPIQEQVLESLGLVDAVKLPLECVKAFQIVAISALLGVLLQL